VEILKILIPMALFLGSFFIFLFIWATKSGQFDDLDTPSKRMLFDDEKTLTNTAKTNSLERKEL
jgi:cbb3-type cytochrome oxidase maturation protein